MADTTPPPEPTPERPSGSPPPGPPSGRPPSPDDNWPDFSASPAGGRPAPPTGPYQGGPGPGHPGQGYPGSGPMGPGQPGPGYGPPAWGPGGPPPNPQEDRTMAMLAHLGGIIAGFIPALVIYLIKKDTSPYVRKQAAEALNFQITVAIASFVSGILMIVLIGFILFPVVWILNIVLCIMAGLAANRGEIYEYPSWCRIKMID